jgi:FixJ family two-component response regulator
VVVMSGYLDDITLFEDSDRLGVRFLPKPFLPADLIGAVTEAIDQTRAARAPHREDVIE